MKLYELDRKIFKRISAAHDIIWLNSTYLNNTLILCSEDWLEFQAEHGFILHGNTGPVYVEILDEDVFTLTLLKYS